jgi:hypothetical protein
MLLCKPECLVCSEIQSGKAPKPSKNGQEGASFAPASAGPNQAVVSDALEPVNAQMASTPYLVFPTEFFYCSKKMSYSYTYSIWKSAVAWSSHVCPSQDGALEAFEISEQLSALVAKPKPRASTPLGGVPRRSSSVALGKPKEPGADSVFLCFYAL